MKRALRQAGYDCTSVRQVGGVFDIFVETSELSVVDDAATMAVAVLVENENTGYTVEVRGRGVSVKIKDRK
jgi:hypothetical protein